MNTVRFSGLITIEDVMEQIVGDIEDEYFQADAEMIELKAPGHFIVNGLTPLEDIQSTIDAHFVNEGLDTIGGYIAQRFGYIPKVGESLQVHDYRIQIKQVDHRRIRQLDIRKIG